MWSSDDDDVEALPESVTNYDFVDEREEPISFSVLPVQWAEGETFDGGEKQIFLRGITDDGLRKIYKQVIAWKVDLTHVKPEISVLSKDESWIMLQRPRKIFEKIIRSILITVHCLHFIKYHPTASAKLLWDNMSRVFSLYEVSPSQNDLVDHYNLIADVVKREEALSRSKFLLTFLEEKPKKSKVLEQDLRAKSKSSFIVDDTSDEPQEDESAEEQDHAFMLLIHGPNDPYFGLIEHIRKIR
ncbi:DNA (cytosine-5)-methyltransferase 1, replication foci domain, partial [Dillenia turbinata]